MKSKKTDSAIKMLLIAGVISAVGTVVAGWASGVGFWFPQRASTVAAGIDLVFNVITWISIFFLILVTWLTVLFAIKYRRREHSKATSNVTHNTPLELTWTIIPLLLVIVIFYVGMVGYLDLRRAPAGAYEVNVHAKRWSWSFKHRNGCDETNELSVPVGKPVRLIMQSDDVLHALFIPAFRVKQDIIPNRITDLWFQCTDPGTYELFCAEYCGKDHSQMHALVIAYDDELVSPKDGLTNFQRKIQECAAIFDRATPETYPDLAMRYLYPRCASCHTLDGKANTGPTWKGLWHEIETGNVVFTDGTKLSDLMGPGKLFETPEEYIRQSILNPQQKVVMNFTPGAMTTFKGQLDERKVFALIELIKHLDEFDNTGKRINPLEGAATQPDNQSPTTNP